MSSIWYFCLLTLMFFAACAQHPQQSTTQTIESLPSHWASNWTEKKEILKLTQNRVYEIVVPRPKDPLVTYQKPIPWDILPFANRKSPYISIGSAFSLQPGVFTSCAHVFELPYLTYDQKFLLRTSDGKVYPITEVLKYSEHRDIIEFQLAKQVQLPTLATAPQYSIGDVVYSVGNALGEGISIRSGMISSLVAESEFGQWNNIRFSAAASPGNSGGPLVNEKGEVVGVIQAKSESENLNHAYPINLLSEVSNSSAHILKKNHFSPYQLRHTYVLDFSLPLPAPVQKLRSQLHHKLATQTSLAFKDFLRSHQSKLYTHSPGLSSYLLNQQTSRFWNQVYQDSTEKWSVYGPQIQEHQFKKEESLVLGHHQHSYSVFTHSFIYRPSHPLSAYELLENPATAMTRFLQITGRQYFGNVSIDIKSIKSPESTHFTTDILGRRFRIDHWRLRTFGLTYISACTGHPKGLACLIVANLASSVENYGAVDVIKHELASWLFSPAATYQEWARFQKLPQQWYHPSTHQLSIKHNKKSKKLSISSPFAKARHPGFAELNDLNISLELAYDKKLPLKLVQVGLGFFDEVGHFSQYVMKAYRPTRDGTKHHHYQWQQALNKQGDFSGELYTEDNEYRLNLVAVPRRQSGTHTPLASHFPTKVDSLIKVFCFAPTKYPATQLTTSCHQLFNSLLIQKDS